ncbi:MAG: radical SAM protein [Geobacter sp.]|nr:radical SAM protein [Geobacter sp.]
MSQDRFAIDGHKLYWHLDRVADWQKNRLIAPVYMEISPVSYCNHHCLFCGLDFAHNESVALDAGILMTRIEEMGRLGVKSIMFAGEGEPLLHPRMVEIAAHTKSCGIDVSITTNGMIGNAGIWEELLPSLTWVRFSIDAATSETYAKVHGISPGSFDRTITSLKEAVRIKRERDLPVTIGVQFLMIHQNLADIEPSLQLYSDICVDYLSFKPYSEHPQMINKSGFTYSASMIDSIEKSVQAFVNGSSAKTAIIFRKAATEAYNDGVQRFTSCCALPFWGYLSSKGDFYTCSVYLNDDRFMVGSIYTETMEEIFFGEKRKKSIAFAETNLEIGHECRVNCRMARINEFLAFLNDRPDHVNFI